MLRVRARFQTSSARGESEERARPERIVKKGKITLPDSQESPGMELDMRGMRVDEGLDALEPLEKSLFNGLTRAHYPRQRHRSLAGGILATNPHVDGGGRTEGGEGGDSCTSQVRVKIKKNRHCNCLPLHCRFFCTWTPQTICPTSNDRTKDNTSPFKTWTRFIGCMFCFKLLLLL